MKMAEGDSSTGTKTLLHTEENYQHAQSLLKKDCESIWSKIEQIQTELSKQCHVDIAAASVYDSIRLTKEKQLKAQIEAMKDVKTLLPMDDVVQFEVTKQQLEESIQGLQDTLTLVKSEHEDIINEMLQEEKFNEETEQIEKVLVDKLAEALLDQQANNNIKLLNDLKAKKPKLRKCYNKWMKNLSGFVMEHFPEPTDEQITAWRKMQGKGADEDIIYIPLLTILQQLMNQCMDSPHDRYITINDSFWPPYVELLVRSGIAIRNPRTDQQIQLIQFHL